MRNAVRLGEMSVKCTGTYRNKKIEEAKVVFCHSTGMVKISVRLYFSKNGVPGYYFQNELLVSYEDAKEIQKKDINSFLMDLMAETADYICE